MLNSCEGSQKFDSTAFKLAGVSTNFCLHGLACDGVSDQSFYLSMWACLQWVVLAVWSVSSYIVLSRCSQLWNCGGGGGGLASCCIFTAVFGKGVGALVFVTNVGSAVSFFFFFFFAMEGNWWSGGNSVTLFMLLKDGESSDEASPQKYVIFLFLMLFIIR